MSQKWIEGLDIEDQNFIKTFVLKSGSLKEVAKVYEVTYPTIRLRLNRVINKILMIDQEDDAYVQLIKNLALEGKMDFETCKLLVEKYREEK